MFLGSSLVLPWSLTRGGLGRYKGREILIKVLFWEKAPEYNSGIIDKECICESRCCERRAQYGLGRRNMLKHANGVSELLFVLCIALTPQSGDSSGAILEVPFKALLHLPHARNERTLKKKDCLNFPEKDSFLTEERLHTRKEPHGCAALLHILARACSLFNYSLSQLVLSMRR